ncbi:MAG TPA: DUF2202 domain-containing protein, partial [Ornithinibacter sp.]|nr:DUF2202 domain-containing protein [Ornithinibacter sp.]
QHFDSVGTLLDRYDVTDPAAGKAVGTYADPAIQKLYDGWLAEGSASLEAAYQVGVELETRDNADLEKSIAGGLPTDIDGVLGRLLQASQRHLAAYQRAVDGDLGTGTGAGAGTMGRWSDDGTGAGRGPGMGGRGGHGNGPGGNAGSGMNGMNGGDCPYTDTDD